MGKGFLSGQAHYKEYLSPHPPKNATQKAMYKYLQLEATCCKSMMGIRDASSPRSGSVPGTNSSDLFLFSSCSLILVSLTTARMSLIQRGEMANPSGHCTKSLVSDGTSQETSASPAYNHINSQLLTPVFIYKVVVHPKTGRVSVMTLVQCSVAILNT